MLKRSNGKTFTRSFKKFCTLEKRLKELSSADPSIRRKELFIDSQDYVELIDDLIDDLRTAQLSDSNSAQSDIHYYLGMLEENIHELETFAYESRAHLNENRAV